MIQPIRQLKLLVITLACTLVCLDANAARRPLASGGNLCADQYDVCFEGSVIWDKNDKLISIEGELKNATEPGELHFWFSGFQGSGDQVFMDTKIEIRGNYGEHFSKRLIMPFSSETIWSLQRISYKPEMESD